MIPGGRFAVAAWWKARSSSRPLDVPMRRRLELACAVVLTAGAIVALSRAIRPDPSRSKADAEAVMTTIGASLTERDEKPYVGAERLEPPKVSAELASAIANGDLDAAQSLLTPGTPLDDFLAPAAESGSERVVRWLLDHGADVHTDETSPRAPLLAADEHPEIAAVLLERGANAPPLASAAAAGAIHTVTRLLAEHVAVNPPDASPLLDALTSTRPSASTKLLIVEKLLAAGADPNRAAPNEIGDVSGSRPLTAVVRDCGDPGVCIAYIQLLLRHGARVDGESLTAALQMEAWHVPAIADAIFAGPFEPGATAVALAREGAAPRTIAKLAARGIDWGWHDGEDDAALPLVAAVLRSDLSSVRALLDAGAPIHREFKSGLSALGAAFGSLGDDGPSDAVQIIELLLARGADVNRRLPDGRSPLFAAAEAGNLRIIRALLDRGARVNEAVLDETPLDAAERGGHVSAARILHAQGGRRAVPRAWDGR